MNRNDFIVIIPARYASTRFPGKPLARIGGVEMIVRVCRRVQGAGFPLAVATDDRRIADCVEKAGFTAVMTSEAHRSGTDRVMEAYTRLGSKAPVVINVQGDEPFIDPAQIESLAGCFDTPGTEIATLVRRFDPEAGFDALFDPNLVKVVFSDRMEALYFSRSIIPYVRKYEWKEWLSHAVFHTHVGVYAYRADILRRVTSLPQSSLELAESLEQLRWLQAGLRIKIALTESRTIGIDSPADLEEAEKYFSSL